MKSVMTVITLFFAAFALSACAPEVGSPEWCEDMKEKDKGEWSANEAVDFTKHCVF